MKKSIFNRDFWMDYWQTDRRGDTHRVHKGFSTPEYWDRASETYDSNPDECKSRQFNQTLSDLKRAGLLFEGVRVLDIGCGTGSLALALAGNGAFVTGVDFSAGMLGAFRRQIPDNLEHRIHLVQADWGTLDINAHGWEKNFNLVTAFMSPGVSSPELFLKMMACAQKGCAIRGWAQKFPTAILTDLWQEIMGTPLEDKPQSILYKINLLFSMGYFPDIRFDPVSWDQTASLADELERQVAFFSKVSEADEKELSQKISSYLDTRAENRTIIRDHRGRTATAIWRMDDDGSHGKCC